MYDGENELLKSLLYIKLLFIIITIKWFINFLIIYAI